MTIHEYLNYPMGKNSAIFMIGTAKEKMIERFLLIENEIKMIIYNTGNTFVFHMELPSESSKGLTYDVVIEVPFTKNDENRGNNIFQFPFRVYSNCPSFIYSYAYIFYKKKLICSWLVNRYDKKTLTMAPKKRNEHEIIFYEKSIFFAVYYIFKNLNVSVDLLKEKAVKASVSLIKSKITSQNDIATNRSIIKEIDREEKAGNIEKQSLSKRKKILSASTPDTIQSSKGIRRAKSTKGTKKANTTKNTSRTKSTTSPKNISSV